jgi:hypothetical protein
MEDEGAAEGRRWMGFGVLVCLRLRARRAWRKLRARPREVSG